jgi:arylsulfatase A-like enzyme
VVVVWDGMRPDFISEQMTPNLWKLRQDGVFFSNHHSVFLSSTEVNGTALATGAYPSHSHVVANTEFRPEINSAKAVDMQDPTVIRIGDKTTHCQYLGRPTLAEVLHRQAPPLTTLVAGSKDVVLLQNRAVLREPSDLKLSTTSDSCHQDDSPVIAQGEAWPQEPNRLSPIGALKTLGAFPSLDPKPQDKTTHDTWTTAAVLELWKTHLPAYTILWLAEPDFSQHATAPGSAQSLAAIRGSDNNLGKILTELERQGLRASTDVFVVSDHGFSTINRTIDIASELRANGFDAVRSLREGDTLNPGQVMAVNNGGSTLFYVGGHDTSVCARLASYFEAQDWAGVVLSREAADGTFPLSAAHIDSPQAPDFVVSLRWSDDKNAMGAPGLHGADVTKQLGNHASLSRYDMHNTLVAAGPHIRRGVTDPLPSANTDLAPTILWLLGIKQETAKMDGRILGEALRGDAPPIKSFSIERLTAHRDLENGTWNQYLSVSEVDGVRYLDEGNGAFREHSRPGADQN